METCTKEEKRATPWNDAIFKLIEYRRKLERIADAYLYCTGSGLEEAVVEAPSTAESMEFPVKSNSRTNDDID